MKPKITQEAFQRAAEELGCAVSAVIAVADVESAGSGFLANGKPKILFEGHIFHRITRGKYSATHPTISYKDWTTKHYIGGAGEYKRLDAAIDLDRDAAYMSASWGKFQILGDNFKMCGFATVSEFVAAMEESEDAQLDAFVKFVIAKHLDDELRRKDWPGFAEGYNGRLYKRNQYDTRLARADKAYKNDPEATFGHVVNDHTQQILLEQTEAKKDEQKEPGDNDDGEGSKGVTTGDTGEKPEEEEAGVLPPAPAVEVKPSQPSLMSKITSLSMPTGAVTFIGAFWAFARNIPPWGWAVLGGIFLVMLAIGAWLWNESMKRAHLRTDKVMDAAADKDKNNLRLI